MSTQLTTTLEMTPNVTECPNEAESDRRGFSFILAIFFGLPALIIISFTVFGNFLVLSFKARVGKRQTTLLIWNLGLADFFVGIFVLPLGVSYVVGGRWFFGRLMCKVWASCDVVFCTASIVTLCVISLDRYIGVTRPLRYKLIVTKTKIKMANVGIWFFSISILLATIKYGEEDPCYDPDICSVSRELAYVVHSVVIAFFVPAVVTLLLYWKIYSVAKKREKGLMQGLMMAMGDSFFKECLSVPLRMHCGNSKNSVSQQQQIIKMHKKVAKTLGVVVSAFLFCWLPFFGLYLISYHCSTCIPNLVLDITTWFGYCNSCVNPLIYAFTLTEFRKSIRKAIHNFRTCRLIRRTDSDDRHPKKPEDRCHSIEELVDIRKVVVGAKPERTGTSAPRPSTDQDSVLTLLTNGDLSRSEVTSTSRVNDLVVGELIWSAKLYATLISPQSTKL